MGTPHHGWNDSLGETQLDLLHREADGELTPEDELKLAALADNPDVQTARTALRRAMTLLSGPNPPRLPHSLAAEVAAEVRLSAALTAPPLPHSLATAVAAEIVVSRVLAAPIIPQSVAAAITADIAITRLLGNTPAPSESVAARVASEIATARVFQPMRPRLPASVAEAVSAEIQAAQLLQPPRLPRSVAAAVAHDIAAAKALEQLPSPRPPVSVATRVASRITQDSGIPTAPPANSVPPPRQIVPVSAQALTLQAPLTLPRPAKTTRNPAPLFLVAALLLGLSLLALTTAWPNLAAGATVLQTLLQQVSPLASAGLALLLLTSAVITWKPTPTLRTVGMGAYALAAVLTIPALYNVVGGNSGLSIGHNVTVSGPVPGNVIAIGGNVTLKPDAQVRGEVVTLLGDIHREPGARVGGNVSALLGHAPGDHQAIQTQPVSALSLATAAAFRPVMGWLGSAAWPQIFVALTGSLLLLLFVGGVAPQLAHRQRHAPMRTLALGVLILAALSLPAIGLTLVGLLGPALITTVLIALLVATGLSVSAYDVGRALAYRLRLPVPDAVGALLGLSAFAASLSYSPLAFALALIGGAWGAGTLLLTRGQAQRVPVR